MNGDLLAIAIVALFGLGIAAIAKLIMATRKRPLDTKHFQEKWQLTQKLCAKKDTWPLAVINADKLLDEALKKSAFRGKTMGERLVAAQHQIKDNDAVWFAHKLRNKLVHESTVHLDETDVKDALTGIRGALRDLGALAK